jgi:glycerol-3-phosphate acyltransferase PlsY
VTSALLVVGGYLCGSIPFGVLFARLAGVDVRRRGSGNIGATNVARTAGARLGLMTLAADVAKGAGPIVVGHAVGAGPGVLAATGLAAFAGHLFPFALGFAGGKGVATALGVLVALCPPAAGAAVVAFAAAFAACRYVSVASLAGAFASPLAAAWLGCPRPFVAAAAVMAVLIAWRHGDNLQRLHAGTEPRFSMHKKQAPLAH